MKEAPGKYGGNFLETMVRLHYDNFASYACTFVIGSSSVNATFRLATNLIHFYTVGETIEVGNFDPKIATFWIDSGNVIC